MSSLIASNNIVLIVGVGATGMSVARFLAARNKQFFFADEIVDDEKVQSIEKQFPGARVLSGPLDFSTWSQVSQIVLSPGVPRKHPAIAQAIEQGIEVVGDVELFAREATAPIVAITGSNGKTTVTTLLGEMAKVAQVKVAVGGNIGTPALDLLSAKADLYILELSSFQLESTVSLQAKVATVLNISEDHMDRYENLHEYFLCKQKVYFRAGHIVVNRDDVFTQPPVADSVKVTRFGSHSPDLKDFGLLADGEGGFWIAKGLRKLIHQSELRLRGRHNLVNAAAALALGDACDLAMDKMLECLRTFEGLPHRCQLIRVVDDVDYVNDSKATNVGATIAALQGLVSQKNIILLVGGVGKEANFGPLKQSAAQCVKHLIWFGLDGEKIADAVGESCSSESAYSLADAIEKARQKSQAGDVVLLSPACASFDMFKNYQDRGQQFASLVEAL